MSGLGRRRYFTRRKSPAPGVQCANRRFDEAAPVYGLDEVLDGSEAQALEPLVDDRRDEDRGPAGRVVLAKLLQEIETVAVGKSL